MEISTTPSVTNVIYYIAGMWSILHKHEFFLILFNLLLIFCDKNIEKIAGTLWDTLSCIYIELHLMSQCDPL